jgi:hypothetical protein
MHRQDQREARTAGLLHGSHDGGNGNMARAVGEGHCNSSQRATSGTAGGRRVSHGASPSRCVDAHAAFLHVPSARGRGVQAAALTRR